MSNKNTHRTTISVPEDLYKKMKSIKSFVNFSKVFQDAIKTKIGEIERNKKMMAQMKHMDGLQSIIERLRDEKIKSLTVYPSKKGIEDARRWVSIANYSDLMESLQWDNPIDIPNNIPLRSFLHESMKNDGHIFWSTTDSKDNPSKNPDKTKSNISYLNSFKTTVNNFWESIKDQLEISLDDGLSDKQLSKVNIVK